MFNKIIAPAAVLAALTLTSQVHAGDWVAVPSACVADEASAGKFEHELAAFQFTGDHTGTIDARCNVTNPQDSLLDPNPHWNRMEITYNEPDGSQVNSQVKIIVRRVDKFTGVAQVIATFDSNTGTPGQQLRSIAINHTFNFRDYGYYIGIALKRENKFHQPRVQRVRLFHLPNL